MCQGGHGTGGVWYGIQLALQEGCNAPAEDGAPLEGAVPEGVGIIVRQVLQAHGPLRLWGWGGLAIVSRTPPPSKPDPRAHVI